jgi:hypothetical protein
VIELSVMDNPNHAAKWRPLNNRFTPNRESLRAIEERCTAVISELPLAVQAPRQLELDLELPYAGHIKA